MQNEPNFSKSQMFITPIATRNYSKKMKLDTWSKQTQTKPILPATLIGGFISLRQIEYSFTSWTLDLIGFVVWWDF
jgi:hypothetical protein